MEKKEVLKTVKQVVTVVVSAGVGAIVGNAVRHTSPADMGLFKKACVGVGSLVLGSMLSDKASEYTDAKIDETVEEVQNMFAQTEEATDIVEEEVVEAAG